MCSLAIYKAFFGGLNFRESAPENMARNMVLTYLHVLDPEIPDVLQSVGIFAKQFFQSIRWYIDQCWPCVGHEKPLLLGFLAVLHAYMTRYDPICHRSYGAQHGQNPSILPTNSGLEMSMSQSWYVSVIWLSNSFPDDVFSRFAPSPNQQLDAENCSRTVAHPQLMAWWIC